MKARKVFNLGSWNLSSKWNLISPALCQGLKSYFPLHSCSHFCHAVDSSLNTDLVEAWQTNQLFHSSRMFSQCYSFTLCFPLASHIWFFLILLYNFPAAQRFVRQSFFFIFVVFFIKTKWKNIVHLVQPLVCSFDCSINWPWNMPHCYL